LTTLADPISLASEQYRLLFAKIERLCKIEGKKVIALTSAIKGEGKTTTAANLAVVAARDFGRRCLILDGDFRNPSLAKCFGLSDEIGLADVVLGARQLGSVTQKGPIENLTLLPMGRPPGRESNLWATPSLPAILEEVRGWVDYVWVDAPPILPILDMNLIADMVDGILMVVRAGEVPTAVLAQAAKSLSSPKLMGAAMNCAEPTWTTQYYGYGY
jgi:capsular exopolysaccharide synthesis family protein